MGLIKELIKGLRVTGGTMIRTIAGNCPPTSGS